jgi:putative membrane protein
MKRPDWQESGNEPDYRFTLANERTFLAWIRTALAVLAGGVLLDQFADHIRPRGLLVGVALALILLAAVLAASAYHRWKGNEIAMRHARPLPATGATVLLATMVGCVAVVLAVSLMFSLK